MKMTWQIGMALVGFSLCAVTFLLGCAAAKEQQKEVFPDITETPSLISYPVTRTPEYLRPAWKRFLYSIRPYSETVTANGQAHIDQRGIIYAGSYLDDQKPKMSDWMPASFAVGATGELQF